MAIVKEMYATNGAHIIIRDDEYANATPAELARRRSAINRIIDKIAADYAMRTAETEDAR